MRHLILVHFVKNLDKKGTLRKMASPIIDHYEACKKETGGDIKKTKYFSKIRINLKYKLQLSLLKLAENCMNKPLIISDPDVVTMEYVLMGMVQHIFNALKKEEEQIVEL